MRPEPQVIDTILTHYQGRGRDALLPILWEVQEALEYISPEAVQAISRHLRVPEADIYGVATFYSLFRTDPPAERIVYVCNSPICHMKAPTLTTELANSDAVQDGTVAVEATHCLGLCDHAPSVLISEPDQGEVAVGEVHDTMILSQSVTEADTPSSIAYSDINVLLPDAPGVTPFHAFTHMLEHLSPDDVITMVEDSGLRGRGGATFPTGMKFRLTSKSAASQKYMICNADESEPGTFKDRYLMEICPDLVVEGTAIAAYAIGATQACIFIRGEYPLSATRLQQAIDRARDGGYLGEDILGSGYDLDIEIRRGAGAYICGDETALMEAIEGKRGFPRIKPPYPTTHGLFGKPTACNNVETLCNLPLIVERGVDWFRSMGTEESTGSKLISISGHVNRPGVYEIELGMTLRDLLEGPCGGIDGELQALLMGGAAGSFLMPNEIDVALSFEALEATKSTFGAGAIMAFNQTVDMREVLRSVGHFFEHESCGQCFPCQLGTQRQVEILERMEAPLPGDNERLLDVGIAMTDASICGLGQTASMAVLSAVKKMPHLFKG